MTVVDLGAELTGAARSGLLGWADRLVFVRSDSGEAGPGQTIIPGAIPVDALIAAGHKALAQNAVTVRVAHDPPAPPTMPSRPLPALSVDGHGQAVVRIPFDAHLATGGVLDLDRLSPATAAAARQLAALVTGSSSPDRPGDREPAPDPPPPRPSSSGLPGGLTVPALVIDTAARAREQAGVESPAGSESAGSPTARPVRTVALRLHGGRGPRPAGVGGDDRVGARRDAAGGVRGRGPSPRS